MRTSNNAFASGFFLPCVLVSLLCHWPAHAQHEEETSKPYFSSVQPSLTFKGLTGSRFLLIYSQLLVYNIIAKGIRQNIHTHNLQEKKKETKAKLKKTLLSYPTVSVIFSTPPSLTDAQLLRLSNFTRGTYKYTGDLLALESASAELNEVPFQPTLRSPLRLGRGH